MQVWSDPQIGFSDKSAEMAHFYNLSVDLENKVMVTKI